jgi:thiol-disulfide isomerase/thioredoxin
LIKFVGTDGLKMKYLILIFFFFTLVSCKGKKEDKLAFNENEQIEVYDFAGLQPFLSTKDNTTYIINFWATWCKPCIKELPYFEALQGDYGDKLKVILVSLDFPNKMESQLKPFIIDNNLKSQVILLDDPHENEWIPKVDSTWSGAIPATLIFNRSKRAFYEKSFSKESLNNEIVKFIKI